MSAKFKYKKSCIFLAILITALLVLYIFVRYNLRKELTEAPFDVTQEAKLYFYGLGLYDGNNWLGRIRQKIVISFQDGGKIEYLYDRNGDICHGSSYYANGQIECTGPMEKEDDWGAIKDNGIQRVYYENGQLKLEAGTCPGGAGVQDHGIYREYSEDGKVASEKYLIKGKECTKAEWKDWLKKHPGDIKYSGKIKD